MKHSSFRGFHGGVVLAPLGLPCLPQLPKIEGPQHNTTGKQKDDQSRQPAAAFPKPFYLLLRGRRQLRPGRLSRGHIHPGLWQGDGRAGLHGTIRHIFQTEIAKNLTVLHIPSTFQTAHTITSRNILLDYCTTFFPPRKEEGRNKLTITLSLLL